MSKSVSKQKVVWGTPSFWMNVLPLYFGRYKGFFAEKGIDLEMKYFHGGPELASVVQEGKIQIGTMGVPPFSKAFAGGLPAKIIGSAIIQKLDHYLVGRPTIERITDLKGKKIGILSFGSCDNYFIHYILEKESVDPDKEVELIPLGSSYGDLNCIVSRQVDATFLVEPKVSLGESRGVLKVLARVGDYYPRYQWSVIFAREDFIKENEELVHKVLDAYRRSCRYITENPEECVSYGGRLFKMRGEVFRKALERNLANWETETKIDPAGFENAIEIQKQIGAIDRDLQAEGMVCQM